ncbi:hypothetical protein BC834DRAFT_871359 [Gloeopeniophorella convolvens]|nr:hypothetical protein BC834DRAFT_871359 [Gloeopeniophorella convolvens]
MLRSFFSFSFGISFALPFFLTAFWLARSWMDQERQSRSRRSCPPPAWPHPQCHPASARARAGTEPAPPRAPRARLPLRDSAHEQNPSTRGTANAPALRRALKTYDALIGACYRPARHARAPRSSAHSCPSRAANSQTIR